jgi:hypothetical protein
MRNVLLLVLDYLKSQISFLKIAEHLNQLILLYVECYLNMSLYHSHQVAWRSFPLMLHALYNQLVPFLSFFSYQMICFEELIRFQVAFYCMFKLVVFLQNYQLSCCLL